MWDRLAGELVVDPGKLMRAGWRPSVRSAEGLAAMARATDTRSRYLTVRSLRMAIENCSCSQRSIMMLAFACRKPRDP